LHCLECPEQQRRIHLGEMSLRGTCLIVLWCSAVGSVPLPIDNPDAEVELVQPVETNPTTVNEEDDPVVIVVGPEDDQYVNLDDFGGFGFDLPGVAGGFGGFGVGEEPSAINIDLGNLFGDSDSKISLGDIFGSLDDSGISLSVSLVPADEEEDPTQEKTYSLTDLFNSFSSGNPRPQSNRNIGQGFGLGGFGTVVSKQNPRNFNLGGFFGNKNHQPSNPFRNIFGSDNFKPSHELRPQITSSLGVFGGLTGRPWPSFRNIFLLYNKPELRGHREVFGPVYGPGSGCGLCQLFPSDRGYTTGTKVTLELVPDNSEYEYYYDEPNTEIIEKEIIPGGFVVRINDTAIRVLDENREGVYFILNTVSSEKNDEDDEETYDGAADKNIEMATEIIVEEEDPMDNAEPNITDEGRFDIANDKVKVDDTTIFMNEKEQTNSVTEATTNENTDVYESKNTAQTTDNKDEESEQNKNKEATVNTPISNDTVENISPNTEEVDKIPTITEEIDNIPTNTEEVDNIPTIYTYEEDTTPTLTNFDSNVDNATDTKSEEDVQTYSDKNTNDPSNDKTPTESQTSPTLPVENIDEGLLS